MTSIEYLFNELWETQKDKLTWHSIFEQAKEMHKQEIIDAFDEGQEYEYQYHINNAPKFDSETYYQETFVSKGSDEVALPQQEISDEEIEEEISKRYMHPTQDYAWRDACKWYREQLKQRQ